MRQNIHKKDMPAKRRNRNGSDENPQTEKEYNPFERMEERMKEMQQEEPSWTGPSL